jgi:hypothetical protein
MVWIRIPSLNLAFYDENILMAMAIGKPDMNTYTQCRNVDGLLEFV